MAGAPIGAAQLVVPCPDLADALDFLTDELGFRVDSIFPADAPTVAVISGHGTTLRLEQRPDRVTAPARLRLAVEGPGRPQRLASPSGIEVELVPAAVQVEIPEGVQEFVLNRAGAAGAWNVGRAGMHYRDLIPGRLGGRFIASHIRITEAGEVPDYVHFHRVRFQMIYCRSGWARLVYEDQGGPFLLEAGDCVLQPPEIRHRVLEASAGLEVIEIGCPAVHETLADHALTLPTPRRHPGRKFGGQRFVRHVARGARWRPWHESDLEARDTGIAVATDGLAGASVVRWSGAVPRRTDTIEHDGEFLFLFVLEGALGFESDVLGDNRLEPGDCCVIPAQVPYALCAEPGLEMLEVRLPGLDRG